MWRRWSKTAETTPAVQTPAAPRQLSPEILAQIRKLHFLSRRLADESVSGSYRSAFKGRGIEFEEVREYSDADDVRAIDWKVTARSGKPYVKSYREERELTVMLAVDISASALTATRNQLRDDVAAQAGAVLTLIGMRNNDTVGLVTFSDRVEHYFPPKKARSAVWRILHEVLTPGQYHSATDVTVALEFLGRVLKRRAVIFLLSDFISPPFEHALARLAQQHDVTALWIQDPIDKELPKSALVRVVDPETGAEQVLDTRSSTVRAAYEQATRSRHAEVEQCFMRCGVGVVPLSTDAPIVPPIKQFLSSRRRSAGTQRR